MPQQILINSNSNTTFPHTGDAHQRHSQRGVLSPVLLRLLVRTRDGARDEQHWLLTETRHWRCGDQAVQRQHHRHGPRVTSSTLQVFQVLTWYIITPYYTPDDLEDLARLSLACIQADDRILHIWFLLESCWQYYWISFVCVCVCLLIIPSI